jgi:photosystem II stability/assembly factor-like uncharacterized protein
MKNTASRLMLVSVFFQLLSVIVFAQPATWVPRGIGGGGSMFYPSINPVNDNEFYVACDMSQLFHSTDFGTTYSMVPFTKLQVGNTSVYEFTSNPNTSYCIANDGNINYGVRTLDGGNTWTSLPGALPDEAVFALKADHANPNRVIINYYNSIYISQNAGTNFTLVRNAADNNPGITIAGVFFDGNNIYIGTNEGILFSSNGGTSFAFLATTGMPVNQAIFSFAGAKSGATTRLFCVTADPGDIYNGLPPWDYYGLVRGVYSLDVIAGTSTWTPRLTGININNDFVMYVAMARNDINTVYLGGSDEAAGGNLVMKTTNGGASWSKVFLTASNQNIRTGWSGAGGDRGWGYGESCFGITVAPNNANKVLFGDYGFVHKTSDGGATWQQAYVNTADEHPAGSNTPQDRSYHSIGLENTTCWQVYWQDANNMFACYSDINGIRSTDAGMTWSYDYTGHTINTMYRIAKHATLPRMFAATSNVHDMYQSTRLQDNPLDNADPGGRIIYSDDNGASWQLIHQFGHPVFWVATDPNNANRMYASVIHYGAGTGQGGIWMTNNLNNLGTSTWTQLPEPAARLEGHPASIVVLNDGKMVCTYSGRRGPAGFTTSSGVFIYDPVTSLWTDVTHADMQYWTKDIIIDPSDPTQNTWYVCVFSGWGGAPNGRGGLFRTTNRGSSWTKLTGTQFDRVTSITFNPLLPTQAYLTTEVQGLWISDNMNATTPTWSLVSNYPFRQPERVFFNPFNTNEIWVSSFGNGMKMGLQSIVLPLKLITFSGNRTQQGVVLRWATANEDAGDHFEIQRSNDGTRFETITTVQGNGRTSNNYDFNDAVSGARLYYRIKVVSAGGSVFYSHTLAFNQGNELYADIRVLGNPVKNHTLALQATVASAAMMQINLVDVSGKIILQEQLPVSAGINQLSIALPSTCSDGIYILRAEIGQTKRSLRIAVSK